MCVYVCVCLQFIYFHVSLKIMTLYVIPTAYFRCPTISIINMADMRIREVEPIAVSPNLDPEIAYCNTSLKNCSYC
jgi:hypothetical protein